MKRRTKSPLGGFSLYTYICMTINSEDGYIWLQLPAEPFAILPETIETEQGTLRRKREFHVTLVQATAIPEAELRALLDEYVAETPISFDRFEDDFRLAVSPPRTSIAVRCRLNNHAGLFDRIEERTGQRLPLQPSHVSLYTKDTPQGVGISTEEAWQSYQRLDLPDLTASLEALENGLKAQA